MSEPPKHGVKARQWAWSACACGGAVALPAAIALVLLVRSCVSESAGSHVGRGSILCSVPDVDGDGLDDIACSSPSTARVWVLSGRDAGVLAQFAGSANPARCIAGALDSGEPAVWVRCERSIELRSARTGERLRSFGAALSRPTVSLDTP